MNSLSIILIPALPLAVFVLNGLFGKVIGNKLAGILGTLCIAISFVLSLSIAYTFFAVSKDGAYPAQIPFKFDWLQFGKGINVQLGAIIDGISVMMLIVVTLISLMVHIFSLSYMHGEKRFATYYAFLGLFTFSMLLLVLSVNIFQMYMGWELVGVSSFLLIGFYYDKPSAVAAAKKAFIVTRFADMFFLVGILIVSSIGGSLDIPTLIQNLGQAGAIDHLHLGTTFIGWSSLSTGLLFIFIGGAGKSALFPLHIWLPDAMEGPTPVSALIHAATMVVAGVYLVARLFPIYLFSAPEILRIIAYAGAFTSLFAAIIACTQFDIKRVLAYSTMSQIGYMIFSLGLGGWNQNVHGYTASMFHLFTHAIFKALLFLSAGVVIHYVHSNDMRDMGALRKKMPFLNIVFLIACLAIAGIPPFAGFFSKEMILNTAWEANGFIFILGVLTAGLTAFYMFRLYLSIFWRDAINSEDKHNSHPHSSWLENLPLGILAIGAMMAGFIPFAKFINFDVHIVETSNFSVTAIAIAMAISGILLALFMYKSDSDRPRTMVSSLGSLYQIIYKKFYIDEVYLFFTKSIVFNSIAKPIQWIDKNIVDGFMQLTANFSLFLSRKIRGMQSGNLQYYMMFFMAGLLLLFILCISI